MGLTILLVPMQKRLHLKQRNKFIVIKSTKAYKLPTVTLDKNLQFSQNIYQRAEGFWKYEVNKKPKLTPSQLFRMKYGINN